MTIQELRERLKHIAGLCYGLSSDLSNAYKENMRLKEENEGIQGLLKAREAELLKMRSAARARAYYAKKREKTPEEYRAKAREYNRRAYARKKLKRMQDKLNQGEVTHEQTNSKCSD